MTDQEIEAGLRISAEYSIAAACVKPYSIPLAKQILAGTDVAICAVIGFPHGCSTTTSKVCEAIEAVEEGASEIDMVVNIGKVLSGGDAGWRYVEEEIKAVNDAVVRLGGTVKVIFENDYLRPEHIVELCRICVAVGVEYVKTSTGYGFVKRGVVGEGGESLYGYSGATDEDLMLMKREVGDKVKIKAAGGVRTLDDLLRVMAIGTSRVGATATKAMLEEAKSRGIGADMVEVEVK